MAYGFPPIAKQAGFFDLPEAELAVVIKHTINMLEWGIINRQGKVLEVKTEGLSGDKIIITLKDRGGVHAVSSSTISLFPFDGGRNKRNLQLFFLELDRQVKMFQRNRK